MFAATPPGVLAADVHFGLFGGGGFRKAALMTQQSLTGNDIQTDAAQSAGGARETAGDQVASQADGLENLGASVAQQRTDAHFAENLEQSLIDGLAVVADYHVQSKRGAVLVQKHVILFPSAEGGQSEVRIDGGSPVADQQGEMVNLARLARLDDQTAARAQSRAEKVVMDACRR